MQIDGNDRDLLEIQNITTDWISAIKSKNVTDIISLITEDAIFSSLNSQLFRGKEAVEKLYLTLFSQFNITQTLEYNEIRINGNWAFTMGTDQLVLEPLSKGEPMILKGHTMSILFKQSDEKWKIARGINNITPSVS
jgi:uncharacterized protein (TIGR02246 family)